MAICEVLSQLSVLAYSNPGNLLTSDECNSLFDMMFRIMHDHHDEWKAEIDEERQRREKESDTIVEWPQGLPNHTTPNYQDSTEHSAENNC